MWINVSLLFLFLFLTVVPCCIVYCANSIIALLWFVSFILVMSIILVIVGAQYIACIYIVVYLGAVLTLFSFPIMLMPQVRWKKTTKVKGLPEGIYLTSVGVFLFKTLPATYKNFKIKSLGILFLLLFACYGLYHLILLVSCFNNFLFVDRLDSIWVDYFIDKGYSDVQLIGYYLYGYDFCILFFIVPILLISLISSLYICGIYKRSARVRVHGNYFKVMQQQALNIYYEYTHAVTQKEAERKVEKALRQKLEEEERLFAKEALWEADRAAKKLLRQKLKEEERRQKRLWAVIKKEGGQIEKLLHETLKKEKRRRRQEIRQVEEKVSWDDRRDYHRWRVAMKQLRLKPELTVPNTARLEHLVYRMWWELGYYWILPSPDFFSDSHLQRLWLQQWTTFKPLVHWKDRPFPRELWYVEKYSGLGFDLRALLCVTLWVHISRIAFYILLLSFIIFFI